MKTFSLIKWMMAGFILISISACSKFPQPEIDAAKAAVEDAYAAGAETYNLDEYLALQDSLQAVMEKIESEKSKFFKKYNPMKEKLGEITVMAQNVIANTESNKEELRQEIFATINDVKRLLDENRQLITEAPKGKEGATALLAINSELDVIEESISQAKTMLEAENLNESLGKAKSAQQNAMAINGELKEVISKYKGKNKRS
jgi:hypothetical protein